MLGGVVLLHVQSDYYKVTQKVGFFFRLLPSHIPRLGNSYFWRKRSNDRIGNAEFTTDDSGASLRPTQQVALVGPRNTNDKIRDKIRYKIRDKIRYKTR